MKDEINELLQKYEEIKKQNLMINMKRGVPCKEQLDLSMKMLDVLNSDSDLFTDDHIDCRNYGQLTGIEECKVLMSELLEVSKENVIIYGNSSLNIMYNLIANSFTHGVMGSTPWSKLDKPIKWLCPVPGYDRHFSICEYFNIEMINIEMNENGPDMSKIEKLVEEDEYIKGIWCVPKYSNPNGISYSDDVVKRFANLKPKAKDFRIYWDCAYTVHHLNDNQDQILELYKECEKNKNADMVYKFASTSKISFPGSGVSALGTSTNNIEYIKKQMNISTIGYDKINQLRHVRFFKNIEGIKEQMHKHAQIINSKFELVDKILSDNLKDLKDIYWTKPHGGYFISLEVKGIAKEVVERCKECGILLTPAGSAYPYHNDPNNSNIRLAPTFPSLEEISIAMNVLCLSIKIEYYLKHHN